MKSNVTLTVNVRSILNFIHHIARFHFPLDWGALTVQHEVTKMK